MKRMRLNRMVWGLFVLCAFVLLIQLLLSLRWRLFHDSPLMLYVAYLIDQQHIVPYRDLFDMNLPGTYLICLLQAKILGYSDLAFRIYDLLWFGVLTVATLTWMKPFGKRVAWFAVVMFGLYYLRLGPAISMQREYMALVLFSCGLALTVPDRERRCLRLFVAGVLWGVVLLIKPHFAIGMVPVVVFVAWRDGSQTAGMRIRSLLRYGGLAGLGVLVPVGLAIGYLAATGALKPFVSMARNYWPLYTHLTGSARPIKSIQRIEFLFDEGIPGLVDWLVPVALMGLMVLSYQRDKRRYILLFAGVAMAFGIYPFLSGQFWNYHWIPYRYFLFCASALCVAAAREGRVPYARRFPAIAACLVMAVGLALSAVPFERGVRELNEPVIVKEGVPDRIAQFLNRHMQPGDTVQPLDWTGGAVHGMLLARAPLATSFMYDFHFYHHVDSPYIQELRRRFIAELEEKKPRFVIQVIRHKPWPAGENTTREFRELELLLGREYRVALDDDFFRILERRKDGSVAQQVSSERRDDRPNVIVACIDALRADHLGAYGYSRGTSPFIDRLAGAGVVFDRAYSQSTYTRESIGSVFTGQYPSRCGSVGWGAEPRSASQRMAPLFRDAGYRTAMICATTMFRDLVSFEAGFEERHHLQLVWHLSQNGPLVSETARDFVTTHSEPFFLYLHYLDPHAPYNPPEAYLRKMEDPIFPFPVALYGEVREYLPQFKREGFGPGDLRFDDLVARYDAEVLHTDYAIEMLVKGLEEAGLMENTILVLFADHGEEFLDHGFVEHAWTLYNEVIRVPLIVYAPGRLRPGRYDDPVALVDLLPTVLAFAGIGRDGLELDGYPLFENRGGLWEYKAPPARSIISELLIEFRNIRRSVVLEDWHYIADIKRLSLEECSQAAVDQTELVDKYWKNVLPSPDVWAPPVHEELYNLREDPAELQDRMIERPDVVEQTRAVLERYREICQRSDAERREKGEEEGERKELDPDQREALKGLGYF